jgi:sugar phosphate isomerase/epimerase
MIAGTRVVHPEEITRWDAEIVQISVYRGMKNNLAEMRECARLCRDKGIPYVVHPVRYSIQDKEMLHDIFEMAECADLALILHDEKTADGNRLSGGDKDPFRNTIEQLKSVTEVSFENATDTSDIQWYWDNFADIITLDIGHVESAGLDSVAFVHSLNEKTIDKIRFVHMHRNNGLHGGITDHWPLRKNCRELQALKELLLVKPDVAVILELNETEMIDNSLELIKSLRKELAL